MSLPRKKFMTAVALGDTQQVKELLPSFADSNKDMTDALLAAVRGRRHDVLEALVVAKPIPRALGKALVMAAQKGNLPALQILAPNIEFTDIAIQESMEGAFAADQHAAFRFLLDRAELSPLTKSVWLGRALRKTDFESQDRAWFDLVLGDIEQHKSMPAVLTYSDPIEAAAAKGAVDLLERWIAMSPQSTIDRAAMGASAQAPKSTLAILLKAATPGLTLRTAADHAAATGSLDRLAMITAAGHCFDPASAFRAAAIAGRKESMEALWAMTSAAGRITARREALREMVTYHPSPSDGFSPMEWLLSADEVSQALVEPALLCAISSRRQDALVTLLPHCKINKNIVLHAGRHADDSLNIATTVFRRADPQLLAKHREQICQYASRFGRPALADRLAATIDHLVLSAAKVKPTTNKGQRASL